ncbi:MAG: hypothetical protein ACP5NS_03080 [Candidatus Pacearchaeota archaeon]
MKRHVKGFVGVSSSTLHSSRPNPASPTPLEKSVDLPLHPQVAKFLNRYPTYTPAPQSGYHPKDSSYVVRRQETENS